MTSLAYGKGTYRRLAAGLPELRLINMFVEAAATSQDGVVLMSRPGLVSTYSRGAGPVRGLFYQAGTLGGAALALSGSELYADALLGTIEGAGRPSFSASSAEIVITAGGPLYRTDLDTLEAIEFPDDATTMATAYLGGYFIAVRESSQRFYWSKLLDASSWDGLDYAAAESSPDSLLDMIVIGDVLWLLGQSTIEPWALTGDSTLPFSRIEGRNYQRGVFATGCAASLDNSLFWIGDDHRVYRSGAAPEGLSDAGIEERIAASVSVCAFSFEYEGHKFFCIRLDSETLAYDVATLEWCEFASFGFANWRAQCATAVEGVPVFGDAVNGTIWGMNDAAFTDGGAILQRLFTAFQPVSDGSYPLDVIHLDADFGATPVLVGQGSDPLVELRTSRDGGRTWSDWRQAGLGRQGQYRARAMWRRFGSFDAPGAIFEIRVTDPVRLRVSAVRANEMQGGRSR